MRKVVLILSIVILASCGHDHTKDRVVGKVHELYTKELKDSLKKHQKASTLMRKKIIDSMNVAFRKAPEGKGWYSAAEMNLPAGVIIDFNPDRLDYTGPGPYLIIVKGFDGRQKICKINREKWLMFHRGDILK